MAYTAVEHFPALPTRRPEFIHTGESQDDLESFSFCRWEADGAQPGVISVEHTEGVKVNKVLPGRYFLERIQSLHYLGEIGMRPALERVGIFTYITPPSDSGKTRADVHYPSAVAFCELAQSLPRPSDERDGRAFPFRQELFYGQDYSAFEAVDAAARNTTLISMHPGVAGHDILDHGVASLALPPPLVAIIRDKAFEEITSRPPWRCGHYIETRGMQELTGAIDQNLTTFNVAYALQGNTAVIRRWVDFFGLKELAMGTAIARMRGYIRTLGQIAQTTLPNP